MAAIATYSPGDKQVVTFFSAQSEKPMRQVLSEFAYEKMRNADLRKLTLVPFIGRNRPCPCGSGKFFKNCHGVH